MHRECNACSLPAQSPVQPIKPGVWRTRTQIFARRQTIWDTALRLLTSSSSSDSSLLGTLINVICIAVVNFTAGMLSSVLIFMWMLPGVLLSYQVCCTPLYACLAC